jgi:hypothetical protein
MKTLSRRPRFSAAILGSIIMAAGAHAEGATKTHTLYMGADVSIGVAKGLYAVEDVVGSSWVIDIDGQQRVVSSKEGAINIKVTPSLKLTEVSATVANLKRDRSYTFGNDPNVRLTRALTQTAAENADFRAAQNQAIAAQDGTMAASQMKSNLQDTNGQRMGTGSNSPAKREAIIQQTLDVAQDNLTVTNDQVGSDLTIGRNNPLTSGFDAMDVTFEVSSARKLQNPYVITITRFRPKDGAPGIVQNLVYARALDPIDSHATSVHLLEGGFPAGFELIDFQMHLYNRGEEVATSISSKRVELTSDEAFEYVKIEYEGAHKGETLPPTPVMGNLPPDLPTRLAEGKYAAAIYVRVSKDGMAEEAFGDAACSKKIEDPFLESVIRGIRFKPALSNGKAVEGVASIRLGQIRLS